MTLSFDLILICFFLKFQLFISPGEMGSISATAAGTWAFSKAVSLLSDGTTRHLRKTDVGNEVIRRKVVGDLIEVRDSLSILSLKELETARFQLENGLVLCQQEATTHASSEFEAARRNAEMAFSAVHDLEAKIEATKMAVMAALYQYDDDLSIAHTLCLQYIRRLHELPELKETVRVHLYESTPMSLAEATEWLVNLYWMPRASSWPILRDAMRLYRSVKDWITGTDRKALFESLCRLNLILGVFFLKNKIIDDLEDWPAIAVENHETVQPLDYILSFDRTNHFDIRSGEPSWDLQILDSHDDAKIVCLCQRPKSALEIFQLDASKMTEDHLLKVNYWPCVLYAVNKQWIVIVGQKEGTCMITVLNRISWRLDREKEIAYHLNNNEQMERVMHVSLDNDYLYLLQRNGTITQIDLTTMAITRTNSLCLEKLGPHPYAEGLDFDEPLDEYEVEFIKRTDKIKLKKDQTVMDNSLVVVASQYLASYDIITGKQLVRRSSEHLQAGLDVLSSITDGYACFMYIRSEDDNDILSSHAGCELEIRILDSLDVIASHKMPYFRQSRHLVVEREGDFLAVMSSRTLSLWELNSATLLAEYTYTSLEPVSIRWFCSRFLLVTFSGGVICKYEIMS